MRVAALSSTRRPGSRRERSGQRFSSQSWMCVLWSTHSTTQSVA